MLSGLLVVADRYLGVEEDARLNDLLAALPGINCGGCGYPSCRAFAVALLSGEAVPAACSVSPPEAHRRIADFLGIAVGTAARQVARLACAGGQDLAPSYGLYQGEPNCAAAAVVAGGGKACAWGCLGHGDCEHACNFDAIRMEAHGLPVVEEALCTACGDCVRVCPKDLFRLVPEAEPLWVACNNPQAGNGLLEVCAVACTACNKCVYDASGWLRMDGNLPRLVAGANGKPPRAAIERCPTGAIVWVERGRYQRGTAAQQPHPLVAPLLPARILSTSQDGRYP